MRKFSATAALVSLLLLYAINLGSGGGPNQNVSSGGTVKAIGCELYDENLLLLHHIDWGLIAPTDNKTVRGYLKNTGNGEGIVATNVYGEDPTDLFTWASFTFSLSGSTIAPNLLVPCEYTLSTVNAPPGTNFSFNITVAVM